MDDPTERSEAPGQPLPEAWLSRRRASTFAALLLLVAAAIATARVDRAWSDPRCTLVTSQAILKTGSIKLDYLGAKQLRRYGAAVVQKNGHYYNYFPLGAPVLALPLVAVTEALGFDVVKQEVDARTQRLQVMLIEVGCAALLVLIADLYLSWGWALLVSALFWFGTSFASSQATALWSHDFAAFFALLALYLALAPFERFRRGGLLVGLCLFLAYFCRPTLALLTPFLLLYLWWRRRSWVFDCGLTVILGLAAFMSFSQYEFQELLPAYYLPERLSNPEFWKALYANLVSPSRGIFVFSPLLALPIFFASGARRALAGRLPTMLLAIAWPVSHVIAISQFPHWWGGFSFGPRLATDMLPGAFILLCLAVEGALRAGSRWLAPTLGVLGLASVAINTGQGLNNPATIEWVSPPSIDDEPERLFDWGDPQFLATEAKNERRSRQATKQSAAVIRPRRKQPEKPEKRENKTKRKQRH
ncbi:MAG TPA: hypothetical protein VMI54_24800 [Polyangiaceae bacterium]|nr:hypothetical protein [Polyangiaceae bacterium]